jgi:tRNA threonylcarbamoyladenosine biosynthesis protein TsaB
MRLVAIDTAGPVIGVAALDGPRAAFRTLRVARGTEGVLPGFVAEVLAELGLAPAALDGIVVAAGPGAFTGLRVGIAAATGLATALRLPIVGADPLRARARSGRDGVPVLAALDARKGRVYAAAWGGDGRLVREAADVGPDVAARFLPPPFVATGEGALVYRAVFEAAGGEVAADAADPGVVALAREGARALAAGEGQDPVDLVPRYVRAPDVGA